MSRQRNRQINHLETDAGRGAEPTAVAWLAFEAEPGRLTQLGREQCLAMANAVLATAAGRGRPYGLPPTLMERLTAVAGRAVELAAWLATVSKTPIEVSTSTGPAAGRDDASLLLQLADAPAGPRPSLTRVK
jgi:hypothetical protein